MAKKYGKRKQTPDLHETELYDKVTKLESKILSQLEYLNKKKNYKFDCIHCYQDLPSQYDPKKNYYDEFWKSYMINMVCLKRYQEYRDWILKISKKMTNVENTYNEHKKIMEPIESKRRKSSSQSSQSDYECAQCGKKYKDVESLNIHLSIKHKNEHIKLQAKIEELNDQYIENSEWENNYYEEKEQLDYVRRGQGKCKL